jgi:peroxiredoxin
MARTPSTMLPLGTPAPEFELPDTEGHRVALGDFAGSPLLVMFICNHCPFVVHLREALAEFSNEYMAQGLSVVAINANDVANYPDDSPEKMRLEKLQAHYPFEYLFDETQAVAHAFRAACTPDFFLFDRSLHLSYRGQFDASRPGNGLPVTGADLRAACDAVLADQQPSPDQKPSMGCNIKWKPGNEPSLN